MEIYTITSDTNHSGDPGRDAFLVPFENATLLKIAYWKSDQLPEKFADKPIYFDANFDLICNYDYPYIDISIPVMSKKMIAALSSVGAINWSLHQVVMLQDTYLASKFDDKLNLLPGVPTDNSFSAVKLNSYCPCFDYDNAKFVTYEGLSSITITDLVLKEPDAGFPPIFRIKEQMSSLFITGEVKHSLEAAAVKGVIYNEVKTTPLTI